MNKTITASLAGIVFHIDENGYAELQRYLESIRSRLGNDEDANEIMQDIESRIAELFLERINDRKEAVSAADVDDIIKIMGSPQDYVDADAEFEENETHTEETARSLFRDEDNKMIGGVCAGLSNYFGWEVTWVRIIFLGMFLFFGTGIFLYLVLWFILPAALSTADKLKMKGEKVNAKTIKEHLKSFANEVEKLDTKQNRDKFNRAGKQLFSTFSRIFGFFSVLFATILLVTLVYWVFTNDFIISVTNTGAHGVNMKEFLTITLTPIQQTLINVGVIAFMLGPIIGLYTAGVRIYLKSTKSVRLIAITSTTIWIMGIVLLTAGGISIGRDRSSAHTLKQKYEITTDSDVVYLDILDDKYFSNSYRNTNDYFFELLKLEDDRIIAGWPKVDVYASETDQFELWVYKSSNGKTQREAIDNATNTYYPVEINGNHITVSPYFIFDLSSRYKGQDIEVILKVPNGKKVSLSDSMGRVLNPIENEFETDKRNLVGRTWVMKNNQLKIDPS